jgi:hypothetical protein
MAVSEAEGKKVQAVRWGKEEGVVLCGKGRKISKVYRGG